MLKPQLRALLTLLLVLIHMIMAEHCLARSEHEIKAAYVYHFIKFIQWPSGFEHRTLNICTLDDAPLTRRLEPLAGQHLNNQLISVTALSSHDKDIQQTITNCSVTYIGRLNTDRLIHILPWLNKQSSLTISDIEGFTDQGGMIELVKHGDLIRFNINLKQAKEANLFISSKLLELAHSVTR